MKVSVICWGCVGAVTATGQARDGHEDFGVDPDRTKRIRLTGGQAAQVHLLRRLDRGNSV
jgi:UDP-glucose 6-dehydrogenase